jgi:hypothetical protein
VLPFVRGARRCWFLSVAAMAGVFIWFWTFHQDRYLQALVPWMAAVTAAVLALAWRAGRAARVALATLLAAQIIWAGDVPFLPTHAMVGTTPYKVVLDLVSAGHRKDYEGRFNSNQSPPEDVGKLVRPGSTVLLHDQHMRLGLRVRSVLDSHDAQTAIEYRALGSARAAHELLRSFGVTHLFWQGGHSLGWDHVADDLVFYDLALRHTRGARFVAGGTLAELGPPPREPRVAARDVKVGVVTCQGIASVSLSDLDDRIYELMSPAGARAITANAAPGFLDGVTYLVSDAACGRLPIETAAFVQAASRGSWALWVRAPQAPAPTLAQ